MDFPVKMKTLDGSDYALSQETLNAFRTRLKGPVLMPGEAGYEDSRTVWNAMIDRKPALIVRCLGTADVIESVRFAREQNLLLCIKGGGHNVAGLATADGALMLDMSLMRGVWVDAKARIAHVQAGSLNADVDRETQLYGLATVMGFVSQTGAAGLTLGGGLGYLTRRFGWTVDNVTGMDVVTADGRLMHASSVDNPELFWALRGGGGNFGVVTSFEYKLHPVGPQVVGGFVAWPASEASRVMDLFRSLTANTPQELTLLYIMRPAPPAPWLPKERHATPIVLIGACYSGDLAEGERLVAPIKSLGAPIGDILVRRPYTQLQSLLDGANPKGRRCYWKSEFLPGIEPAFATKLIEQAASIPSPHTAVTLFQLGGAMSSMEGDNPPVGNRDARFVMNLAGAWESSQADSQNMGWVRYTWTDLRQYSTGGNYLNFQAADEGPERIQASLGKDFQRLAAIKASWDPQNVFRTNRNILPAA